MLLAANEILDAWDISRDDPNRSEFLAAAMRGAWDAFDRYRTRYDELMGMERAMLKAIRSLGVEAPTLRYPTNLWWTGCC